MTIEELKGHCVRQITEFERIKEIMPVTPSGYKHYEEHKFVLMLIETLEEDAISRNELLKMTESYKSELGRLKADPFVKCGIETVESFIKEMPTISELKGEDK